MHPTPLCAIMRKYGSDKGTDMVLSNHNYTLKYNELFEGIKRIVTEDSKSNAIKDNGVDGLNTIFGVTYDISNKSTNSADNVNVVNNPFIYVINIFSFECLTRPSDHKFKEHDLRDQKKDSSPIEMKLFQNKQNKIVRMGMGGLK